jgi:hypothetical protein
MLRQVLAVMAGFAVWSAVWMVSNSLLIELHVLPHGPRTPILDAEALLALLVAAIIASLAAGYAVAFLRPPSVRRPVLILATLLITLGVVVQFGLWDRMPLWYHVAFLTLLLPMCIAGARLHKPAHRLGNRRPLPAGNQAHQPD